MRKNTAGLVALIVLAIATVLMIFVVLPNVNDGTAPVTAQTPPAPQDQVAQEQAAREQAAVPPAEIPPAPSAVPDARPRPATPPNGRTPAATAPAAGQQQAAVPPAEPPATPPAEPPAAPPVEPPAAPAAASVPNPGAETADTALKGDRPTADPSAAAPTDAGTPSFDILRVEPDGSTVVAGKAEPNSKLEIVNGGAVVGTADVGRTGDFAAIFDKPLPPGDYQLTLRSTGPSGVKTESEEVATVSIPKTDDGELLAMVTRPGEASRIITAPGEASGASAPTGAPPSGPAPAPGQSAALETPPPAAGAPAAVPVPAAPVPTAPVPAPAVPAPQAAAPASAAPLSVSAVEIEGDRLFVAGTARPGATVRIYADDMLVGEAKADAQGRFVVDGVLALSVGQHVIRADMLGPDGVKVQMRASVPFERPEGNQIAAVAQTPSSNSDPAFDGAIFDASRMEAAKAFALLKSLFADGRLPGLEQLAAARSATEIALTSLSNVKPVEGMQVTLRDKVFATTKAAGEALAILKALPNDAAAVAAALGRLEAAMARVLGAEPAAASAVAETRSAPSAQMPAAGEPQIVQQAPLQQSKSSVIIRRGDTLWQISRRVYGAGVRYTTIYVANEEQIVDPDRILPGQVFGVPDKAMPDAESEKIHREHMLHRP